MKALAQRITQRPLLAAFAVSFAAHATVLAVRFVDPDALGRRVSDGALEVILVNAHGNDRPTKPQALAQANLDGGGQSEDGRRRSPLPVLADRGEGDAIEVALQRLRREEAESERRLAMIGGDATLSLQARDGLTSDAQDELKAQLALLQAEIAQQMYEYQKRPRRHHFMPSASEYRYARYVEDWRAWVERVGNEHYPEEARGRAYGELRMTVVLRSDGSVAESAIEQGSGIALLDRAARRIVSLSSPFAPFPPDIARDTDLIEITRTWRFANDRFATQVGGSANVLP